MVCLPLPLLPPDESGLRTVYDSVTGEAIEVCVPPGIDEAAKKLGIQDSVGCISLIQVVDSPLAAAVALLLAKRVLEPCATFPGLNSDCEFCSLQQYSWLIWVSEQAHDPTYP